jgi:lipoprotein NlpD
VGLQRKLVCWFLLFVVLLSSGCGGFVYHHVQAGETLYSISWKYGLDYRDVAKWNHIQAPYTIYDGQQLRVMPPSEKEREDTTIVAPQGAPVLNGSPSESTSTSSVKHPSPISSSSTAIEWQWPVKGLLTSTFSNADLSRKGIDISGKPGQSIQAAAAGSVVYAGSGLLNYGKLIILKHNDNYLSAYAYNRTLLVSEGEVVAAGQHIADMGVKANGDAMLHFEIRYDGRPINPLKILPKARQ